jgi:chromosome segregation ATPase
MNVRAAGESLPPQQQDAPKILISLTKVAWQDSCKAETKLKSTFDFIDMNSVAIKNLNDIKTELDAKIIALKNHIDEHQVALDELGDKKKSIAAESKLILAHMENVQKQLNIQIKVLADYQSPDTKQKICNAKKIEIQAAINVLKSQTPQTNEIKNLINTLEDRYKSLKIFPKK